MAGHSDDRLHQHLMEFRGDYAGAHLTGTIVQQRMQSWLPIDHQRCTLA